MTLILFAALTFSAIHDEILRRAQLWLDPTSPVASARLGDNPAGKDRFTKDDVVPCRFSPGFIAGSTPKFDCELESGERVKVKYGQKNAEVYTEVAATRLLAALGLPADRMYVVGRVRCFGCPADPFPGLQCVNDGKPIATCFPHLDYDRPQEFEYAVIERPIKGRRIETRKARGWTWEELGKIDPSAGGAPREQVDALRLLAIFLGHWDNKAKNQRLLCLGEPSSSTRCRRPVAMIQDLGATFGPEKLDLEKWRNTPIWVDAASCRVSMKKMPYGGSTFPDTQISEEGRRFLATRLQQISSAQIRELFEGARIADYPHKMAEARNLDQWVRVFEAKVRAIADRTPCPEIPAAAHAGR